MEVPENGKIIDLNGLTVYPLSIQLAATQIDQEGGHNEADSIVIDNFLRTLAEIAVNVATREIERERQERDDEADRP